MYKIILNDTWGWPVWFLCHDFKSGRSKKKKKKKEIKELQWPSCTCGTACLSFKQCKRESPASLRLGRTLAKVTADFWPCFRHFDANSERQTCTAETLAGPVASARNMKARPAHRQPALASILDPRARGRGWETLSGRKQITSFSSLLPPPWVLFRAGVWETRK